MKLRKCLQALLFLLPAGALSAAPALTPDQQQEVRKIVADYLRSNPEAIIEAIHIWQQKQKAAEEALKRETIGKLRKDSAKKGLPVWGNPEGGTTIVEFSDYNCPYCKKSFPRLKGLVEKDGDIRVVMKEFPVLGPGSVYAAKAALAAQRQGKYAAFHEAMMSHPGRATPEAVDQVAARVGLDVERMKKEMNSAEIQRELDKNRIWAERLGINGTPAFVIGDRLVPGAVSAATMKRLVEASRSKKK